jgi:hypothetical protein
MQAVSLSDLLAEAPEKEHTSIKRELAKVPVEHQASIRSLAREVRYDYAGVGVASLLTIIMILVRNLPLILRVLDDLPGLFNLIRDLFSQEMWPRLAGELP